MLSIIRDRYHSATQATQNATNKVRREIVSALSEVVVFHFRSAKLPQQLEVPREVRAIRKLSENRDGTGLQAVGVAIVCKRRGETA